MIRVKSGIRAEEIRFQGQHTLFVEGQGEDAIDPAVLNELFDHSISIKPMGPSYNVKSVAQALFPHHPTYYFLIDRDHHSDDFIDRCWENFPNPETHNLLVWRRHEIENYFLEPEYLIESKFCRVNLDELKRKILQCAGERLFLDTAKHVVISIREEFKKNWFDFEKFKTRSNFQSKEAALQVLKNAAEFAQYRENVTRTVAPCEVERRFHECLETMTGEQEPIAFGIVKWLHMIQGKKLLAQIINSNCFQVQTADGTQLSGKEKLKHIVKDLLRKNPAVQPADFIELKQLIEKRINRVA